MDYLASYWHIMQVSIKGISEIVGAVIVPRPSIGKKLISTGKHTLGKKEGIATTSLSRMHDGCP